MTLAKNGNGDPVRGSRVVARKTSLDKAFQGLGRKGEVKVWAWCVGDGFVCLRLQYQLSSSTSRQPRFRSYRKVAGAVKSRNGRDGRDGRDGRCIVSFVGLVDSTDEFFVSLLRVSVGIILLSKVERVESEGGGKWDGREGKTKHRVKANHE